MTISSYKSKALLMFLSLVSPVDAWLSSTTTTSTAISRRTFAPSTSTASTTTTSTTALQAAAPSSEVDPVEQMRLRLEMHWELEESKQECHVEDPSTCGGEVCDACGGHGEISCRFCRGTGQLYMNMNDGASGFCSCPICSHTGHETCQKCKGTGWVAHWTTHGGDSLGGIGGSSSLNP